MLFYAFDQPLLQNWKFCDLNFKGGGAFHSAGGVLCHRFSLPGSNPTNLLCLYFVMELKRDLCC